MKSIWRIASPIAATAFALLVAASGSANNAGQSGPAKHDQAKTSPAPSGLPAGFTVTPFGTVPSGLTNPDDITRLDKHIFISYQNNANADGTPLGAQSTIVEYGPDGTALDRWNLTGRCDGLTANPASHQLVATINEDANSSLAIISPQAAPADQIRLLAYTPDPARLSGGGTDAVTILDGVIYVSASNPSTDTAPALFQLRIPRRGSTASLQPLFADNAQALQGNAGTSGPTTLNLTDPDSSTAVPAASPRFPRDLMLDSQADSQLVFASHPGTPQQTLTLLDLGGPQVDDVRWADTNGGGLYVVDQGADQIWLITGPFRAGTVYTSIPSGSPLAGNVGVVDLNTGSVTPFATGLVSPKGLLYVGADGDQGETRGD